MTVAVATVAFTAALVAEATGGRLAAGSPDAVFAGVSIDSRTTAAGALFVAIQGDRFDGHEFVTNALSRGASGLLVSQPMEPPPDVSLITVPDTLRRIQEDLVPLIHGLRVAQDRVGSVTGLLRRRNRDGSEDDGV